jgi:K(+)-stimulated pyrophosphate-energized sodium pump
MEEYAALIGLGGLVMSAWLYRQVTKQPSGNQRMVEIAETIKSGANAYLRRQFITLGVFVLAISALLFFLRGAEMGLAFVLGSMCSGIAAYIGMTAALKANVRSAKAATEGLSKAFPVAFYGGAVMGYSIVGLALIGISALYHIYLNTDVVLGFSFGASTLALFAKAGGGIYTKTADMAADLVGKIEVGIPEDDPRNPAVIADNVGDNVGDVAGMGADLIDSYIASIVSAMIIGTATLGSSGATLPLMFAAAGLAASLLGLVFVRSDDPSTALNRGSLGTCAIFVVLSLIMIKWIGADIGIFYATVSGMAAGIVIGFTTDYFTSDDAAPVNRIAESAKTGAATTILSGFSYGIVGTVPPVLGICVAMIASWYFAGMFGVAMSAVGMLSTVAMTISSDAYGPIVDNAKGIAEQSGLGEQVIRITDKLDSAGNTAKAITKGFAIGAAALTVLSLFAAYASTVGISTIDLMNPYVIAGAFVGALMPPLISALLILSVEKNAFAMIGEVRRQFRENPGILKGETKPDYARVVDMATVGALKELILPSVLAVIAPLVVGVVLGKAALGGFLGGSIFTGVIFAQFMATSGGAWDNAKKFIEDGAFGGKGSEAHKAAVTGDTVGDPFKDTAGPSLNTMITVMSLSATVFAPLIFSLL